MHNECEENVFWALRKRSKEKNEVIIGKINGKLNNYHVMSNVSHGPNGAAFDKRYRRNDYM